MWRVMPLTHRRRLLPKASIDIRRMISSEITTTTTPTIATGLIRDATRRQPTTTTPMMISHDCQGADGFLLTPGV